MPSLQNGQTHSNNLSAFVNGLLSVIDRFVGLVLKGLIFLLLHIILGLYLYFLVKFIFTFTFHGKFIWFKLFSEINYFFHNIFLIVIIFECFFEYYSKIELLLKFQQANCICYLLLQIKVFQGKWHNTVKGDIALQFS